MDRQQFLEAATDPGRPDAMQFVIDRSHRDEPDDVTFSREAVEAMVENIDEFIMARIIARWRKTEAAPKKLRASVHLHWDAPGEEILDQGWPWWRTDDEGPTPIDGSARNGGIR